MDELSSRTVPYLRLSVGAVYSTANGLSVTGGAEESMLVSMLRGGGPIVVAAGAERDWVMIGDVVRFWVLRWDGAALL
jgi:hypothetical protein